MVRHLVPSWEIPVRLRTVLHEEEDSLVEETRSQKVLSMLGRKKRALICGSAGSGKTYLAVEKARRLAKEKREVLIVCFNVRLAEWLRTSTSEWCGIGVFHYHALCSICAPSLGRQSPMPDPQRRTPMHSSVTNYPTRC
jgi:hypothetical protein